MYVSAKGTALSHVLLLIIKKYFAKQEIESLICSPTELAQKFEFWVEEFSDIWRKRNKESELFRIKDVIKDYCHILRNLDC